MMVEGIVRLFLRQQRADLQTLFTACVFILINEVISIVMISLIIELDFRSHKFANRDRLHMNIPIAQ